MKDVVARCFSGYFENVVSRTGLVFPRRQTQAASSMSSDTCLSAVVNPICLPVVPCENQS